VKLKVWRDGKAVDVTVKLGELPGGEASASSTGEQPAAPRWGAGLQDLTPPLRERLGLQAEQPGALVAQVEPGSSAQRAGLQPGDVLVDVGDDEVANAAEARKSFEKAPVDAPLRVRILRQGHGLFLVLRPPRE